MMFEKVRNIKGRWFNKLASFERHNGQTYWIPNSLIYNIIILIIYTTVSRSFGLKSCFVASEIKFKHH